MKQGIGLGGMHIATPIGLGQWVANLLTQVFGNNITPPEKLFKHIFNFGSRAEWRNGRRVVSSYLDVESTKYQCRILNPKTLD